MAEKNQIPASFANISPDVEYSMLRAEILKRLELRYQLINYTLGAFAAFMALGIPRDDSTSALTVLIYPLVAAGIALAWVDNHYRLRLIVIYMRDHGAIWETSFREYLTGRRRTFWKELLGALSIAAIFPGTQLLALAVGGFLQTAKGTSPLGNFALVVSCVALVFTLLLLIAGYRDEDMIGENAKQS